MMVPRKKVMAHITYGWFLICPRFHAAQGVQQCDTTKDYKGITPLGYAIGANRIAVVKLLLDRLHDAVLEMRAYVSSGFVDGDVRFCVGFSLLEFPQMSFVVSLHQMPRCAT